MTLMLRQNFICLLFAVVAVCAKLDLGLLVQKSFACPTVLQYAIGVGFANAIAVWAHMHMVNESGSVVLVGVSTVRRVMTVVLSYLVFPKPFSAIHAGASICIAVGLVLPLTGYANRLEKNSNKHPGFASSNRRATYVACKNAAAFSPLRSESEPDPEQPPHVYEK